MNSPMQISDYGQGADRLTLPGMSGQEIVTGAKKGAYIRQIEGTSASPYKVLFDGTPRESRYSDGIVLLLFFLLALVAQNSYFYRRSFGELLIAPFSRVGTRRILGERNLIFNRVSLNLLIIFLVTAPLALFTAIRFFSEGPENLSVDIWPSLALFFGAVGIWLAFKAAFHKFLGFVFQLQGVADEYNCIFYLGIKSAGAALFPFVVAVPLLPAAAVAWAVAGMVFVVIIYSFALILQWLQLIEGSREQHYYLIAYICTFEILPLLLVAKLLFPS